MKYVFIYITNPSKKEAKKIANTLLDKKLIACANIFPINSMYMWEGKLADEKEFILIAKTDDKNYMTIVAEVEKIHPYKVPCITKIPVTPNEAYSQWLESQIK